METMVDTSIIAKNQVQDELLIKQEAISAALVKEHSYKMTPHDILLYPFFLLVLSLGNGTP